MGSNTGILVVALIGIGVVYLSRYYDPYLIKTPDHLHTSYDYIIVGAGSAGAVVATRLSEDPQVSVLLIEAGSDGKEAPWSHVPGLVIFNQKYIDWQYETEPQKKACLSLINHKSLWARGKVLGGTSVLNYMLYVRGSPKDYDHWEKELGAEGWGYRDVLPFFRKLETVGEEIKKTQFRGNKGPVYVSKPPDPKSATAFGQAFLDAVKELGYSILDDYNGENQIGFSRLQHNVKNGYRMSTAHAYLYPNRFRENLHILTEATVTKIVINEKKEAGGVRYVHRGKEYEVSADREVVVSGGAVNTPQLLMLSGIGPRKHLEQMKIPLVIDSPHVGKNLQDHLMTHLQFSVNTSIGYDTASFFSLSTAQRFLEWMLYRTGPFSWSNAEITGFLTTDLKPLQPMPDLQLYAFAVDFYQEGAVAHFLNTNDEVKAAFYANKGGASRNVITLVSGLLQPLSRGEILLRNSNPMEAPVIQPNYLQEDRDAKVIVEGLKLLLKVEKSKAVKKYDMRSSEGVFPPCKEFEMWSDSYLLCLTQHKTFTIYHPTSTCRMGPHINTSVVDPRLRVHGVKRLRVADASIFPRIVSGNTNVPTMMVGEKCAHMIKEDNNLNNL